MPPRFHLILLIHAHQPCGNFEHVFEKAYDTCYLPFLQHLEKHPRVRIGLHYSGPLITWMERRRPDYFTLLRTLVQRGQVEMVGGGFYEPILVSIPPDDQREQVVRFAAYLQEHFGQRPTGAWLAERVWEPQLSSALASANVDYTLVDDIHFLSAGFEPEELFGVYTAEDCGQTIRIYPGQKRLRYLIPFGLVDDVITYLRELACVHPDGAATMGDDMEKFGVWPGTYEHSYKNGWLDAFFTALEKNSDWLSVSPPGQYLADHAPLGRADLPAASYTEMMEWVLPTRVRQRFNAVHHEFEHRPEVLSFLRGGPWRSFFRKYSESNLLNKKMLHVSKRISAAAARRLGTKTTDDLCEARDLLLRAQCNDAYWHGIFGGLYAPHLRTSLWRNLIRAEAIADRQTPGGLVGRVESLDYDADGTDELLFTSPEYQVLVKPNDGGTVAAMDFRPVAATLINSIARRPEAYHARLREATSKNATGYVTSIHEQTRVKEPGLERFLRYDRWPRHGFRVLLFDPAKTQHDYENIDLNEDSGFAAGVYTVESSAAHDAEILREGILGSSDLAFAKSTAPFLKLTKRFSLGPVSQGCEVTCEIELKVRHPLERSIAVGIESVINLLAPTEPDRFFDTPKGHENLRFSGKLAGPVLRMEDGWQRIRVTLQAPDALEYWIAPIETVSESEEGFERVYQGSQILAVWQPDLTTQKTWQGRLTWRVETF